MGMSAQRVIREVDNHSFLYLARSDVSLHWPAHGRRPTRGAAQHVLDRLALAFLTGVANVIVGIRVNLF
ncbi:hypothetical protein FH063_002393 [Azospirillum argentinense]|uniref:Uncharacterized protein n=1 Tax=Azospirillum argentinense TaxID=2970906 RepID=A0A5B0KPI6_9PROT|nr:hypothetical protein FH063_002393 [Azospirillum argentinense]